MTANESTLVQSNFKDFNGSLHNVYGNDEASYDRGLSILEDRIARLTAMGQQFQAAGAVAAVIPLAPTQPAPVQATPPATDWGTPAPTPAPSFQAATVPSCQHGPRTPRGGVGAKGPWKAWFCSAPKGAGQCDAMWVQKNTPEWSNFPA